MSLYAVIDGRVYDYTFLNESDLCPRREYWLGIRGVKSGAPAAALHFGKAIHAGTDAWRKAGKDDAAGMAAFEAAMKGMPPDTRRNVQLGQRMMTGYYKKYRQEPFTVVAAEVPFKIQMSDGSWLVGRIDGIVDWAGTIYTLETKTASSLGANFMRQFKPNLQVDIYTYAVRRVLGECAGTVVDALSTAQTKAGVVNPTKPGDSGGYLRDITDRSDVELEQFEVSYLHKVAEIELRAKKYQAALDSGFSEAEARCRVYDTRKWACHYYGQCQFLDQCAYHRDDVMDLVPRVPEEALDGLGRLAAGSGSAGNPAAAEGAA